MSEEYNNTITNNIQTTFENTPNNTSLSDELSAQSVYTQKGDTLYAKSHRFNRIIVGTGITLVGVGSILGISNAFVSAPPEISEAKILASETVDSLTYEFVISNPNKYVVVFTVKIPEKEDFTLEVSSSEKYEGELTDLGYDKLIDYDITFTNNVDYTKTLLSGQIRTIKEA